MPVATEARLLFVAALAVLGAIALGLAYLAALWTSARRAAIERRRPAWPECSPWLDRPPGRR